MQLTRYFNTSEFDSPDEIGSGKNISLLLVSKLTFMRSLYGFPIQITSGYRTKAHNKKVGGKKDSSHLKGLAADIYCTKSFDRFILIQLAFKAGFTRIGIHQKFIHLDIDQTKPESVVFLY